MSHWTERFSIILECKDCKIQAEFQNPSPGTELFGPNQRLVMVGAPDVCPKCHNMKVVKNPTQK